MHHSQKTSENIVFDNDDDNSNRDSSNYDGSSNAGDNGTTQGIYQSQSTN